MGDNAAAPPDAGDLYDRSLEQTGVVQVRSVDGRPVSRYGTRSFIGAERDSANPNKLIYATDAVVTIPRDEARLYRREYVRHLADGDLALVESKPEGGAPRNETATGYRRAVAKGPPDAADESSRE